MVGSNSCLAWVRSGLPWILMHWHPKFSETHYLYSGFLFLLIHRRDWFPPSPRINPFTSIVSLDS